MEKACLVLSPVDPVWNVPDHRSLSQLLQSIQFIDTPYNGETDYMTGEHFLDLIAFMGCSPDIKLEPDSSKQPFCYIRLITETNSIEFHGGDRTYTPRCPQCGAPVNDWKNKIRVWQQHAGENTWPCDSCQYQAAPWKYRWRKSAGFGRCFIEINNIYPGEAIPQQALLDTLHSHYQVNWQYFYQY